MERKAETVHAAEISKVDKAKQQVFGWAYITHDKNGEAVIDKSGEYVEDYEELEKAAYRYVVKSRAGGNHHQRNPDGSPLQVGTMIESFVCTPEKLEAMGLAKDAMPTGWWVGYQITDPETWKAVDSGLLRSFSIHGAGRKISV